jgi:nucleoside-diphosphate-sugar epimerase
MKRIVVTGASGFIGRETIAPLIARGFEVHALGRSPVTQPGCRNHACDLLTNNVGRLLSEIAPTHLLHLAWYAVPGKFWGAPDNLDWLAASLRLVRDFAGAGGARVVVAGSCAEYDWSHPLLDEEATPLQPATLYGRAKAALFETLIAAAPVLGIALGWGRVFFPFGPFEAPGRLLSDVVDGVTAGRRVACSDGLQSRDFLHVEDVASSFAALVDCDVTGPVNIASGTATTVRDIVGRAARLAGDVSLIDWGARPRQPGEPLMMAATTRRLREEVGVTPRWTIAAGVADAVERRITRAETRMAQ